MSACVASLCSHVCAWVFPVLLMHYIPGMPCKGPRVCVQGPRPNIFAVRFLDPLHSLFLLILWQ